MTGVQTCALPISWSLGSNPRGVLACDVAQDWAPLTGLRVSRAPLAWRGALEGWCVGFGILNELTSPQVRSRLATHRSFTTTPLPIDCGLRTVCVCVCVCVRLCLVGGEVVGVTSGGSKVIGECVLTPDAPIKGPSDLTMCEKQT